MALTNEVIYLRMCPGFHQLPNLKIRLIGWLWRFIMAVKYWNFINQSVIHAWRYCLRRIYRIFNYNLSINENIMNLLDSNILILKLILIGISRLGFMAISIIYLFEFIISPDWCSTDNIRSVSLTIFRKLYQNVNKLKYEMKELTLKIPLF